MKIALVHYAAPPVIGGVESVIAAHARLMAGAGHDVRIVAGRGAPAPDGWELVVVPLIDPRHAHVEAVQVALNAGRVPDGFAGLVAELRSELERAFDGVDVVIAHNVASLNLNLALTAALHELAGVARVILWHHDVAAVMPDYRASLHEGYPWSLLREAWPGVSHVTVSERRRRELAAVTELPLDAITVVPNGVDLVRAWALEPQAASILERVLRFDVELLLLVPARVTPRKNIELALEVVAALRDGGEAAGLVVTGPVDPHRPAEHAYLAALLERRAALGLDEVAWILAEEPGSAEPGAALSDSVVSDLYRMADLLFLPSRDEGFGLPILEAGASRLPIACADLPPLREVAGDEALYFDLDDRPTRIATRIRDRLEADDAWRLSRRIRTQYTWDRVYRQRIEPLLGR